MNFNSISFFIFLPAVFILYWAFFSSRNKYRNLFILFISYLFYAWWDWRFLGLICASTLVDFFIAKRLARSEDCKIRKRLLNASLVFNLGMIGIFKYFNFFANELFQLTEKIGFHLDFISLSIVLPVGISFYTFQTLSYTIDVYRKEMRHTESIVDFAAYVSFFPQLVAGPIERASALLPQFENEISFEFSKVKSGLRLIVWGFFKKIVIADSLGPIVDQVFSDPSSQSGVTLVLGAVFFAFQIYGDFSGYSDIAIGSAKLLGFDLMSNFKFPYFARDIAEFWKRWHISLSSWFRDYLYKPMGGSRVIRPLVIRNIFIIFLVSGLWHGANWTFVVWGFIHAIFFIPTIYLPKGVFSSKNLIFGRIIDLSKMILTFSLVCVGWVFFRSESISHAAEYLYSFSWTYDETVIGYILYPITLLILEFFIRKDERLEKIDLGRLETLVVSFFVFTIIIFRQSKIDFIYFQF